MCLLVLAARWLKLVGNPYQWTKSFRNFRFTFTVDVEKCQMKRSLSLFQVWSSVMSGHRHATISLICMSTHKAMAARCLSDHQAAYGQPAIRALAMATLRRLALSVLFTIATNSYQTTWTVSERTFNKRQHANARQGVEFTTFTHYDMSCHGFERSEVVMII